MDIDIIKNITFEHSDTDRLRILDTRNRILTDKNSSRPNRIQIRSGNIRTQRMVTGTVGGSRKDAERGGPRSRSTGQGGVQCGTNLIVINNLYYLIVINHTMATKVYCTCLGIQ